MENFIICAFAFTVFLKNEVRVLNDSLHPQVLFATPAKIVHAHLFILGVQLHALIFVDNNYASLNIRHALRCSYWL